MKVSEALELCISAHTKLSSWRLFSEFQSMTDEALSRIYQDACEVCKIVHDVCNFIMDDGSLSHDSKVALVGKLKFASDEAIDIAKLWKEKGREIAPKYDRERQAFIFNESSAVYHNCLVIANNVRDVSKMVGVEDSSGIARKSRNKPQEAVKPSFQSIIQYRDKDGLLKRLHELIDDEKSPARVGAILYRASKGDYGEPYLKEPPTEEMFKSEFPLFKYNNWQAIHNYANPSEKNENKAMAKAKAIVIFYKE